jgi:hypothetical protein
MPGKHPTRKKEPIPPPQPDKKAHTAILGVVLIILTNYQSEVKQIFSFLMKAAT